MGQIIDRSRAVTAVILLSGALIQVVFVLAHGVNKELLGDATFLALDQDASLPSWFTVVLFAFAGLGCGLLAWLRPDWRLPLAVLALLCLSLSLEQTIQLHGDIESDSGNPFRNVIEIIGGVGVVAALGLAARRMPKPFSWLLLAAVVAIVTSAASSEMNEKFDLPYAGVIFFQTLEEVGEMATATLILAAVAEPLIAALASRLRPGEPEDSVRLVGGVSGGA